MTVEIGTKDEAGLDEYFGMFYRCPACQREWITIGFNFCPDCGVQLRWTAELKFEHDREPEKPKEKLP